MQKTIGQDLVQFGVVLMVVMDRLSVSLRTFGLRFRLRLLRLRLRLLRLRLLCLRLLCLRF